MTRESELHGLLLEKALGRIEELEADLAAARGDRRVAVVGMGCRFPGANDPDQYWDLLAHGRDAVVEVPPDRWNADAFHDPDPGVPGRMCSRFGGFVARPADFDASFFGISPREAASIDPQHRLLLEVAWESFEHAGLPPQRLPAQTGVFVGVSNVDYREALSAQGHAAIDEYFSSGATPSTAGGRLSYHFGLTGPCLAVDTACSSSAVAVHLAVRALRAGECELALAGGVNRILTPHESISLSKAGMLSPDGRCRSFDAAANGYVRSEGCGLVVLKRLADALRDNDTVLAVIRGSATNQDGRRSGLTVPHGPSQQAVIRDALRDAGVAAADIGFVEAQGTGTALGDQIEAAALAEVFRGDRGPLVVGSAKSNIGHMESASSVGGLIKVVQAMRHGTIPPNLHFREPSPHIDWTDPPMHVPTTVERWPLDRRLAGVNSFGFGGTNCHIVLEQAPDEPPRSVGTSADRPRHLLTLSAKSAVALRDLALRYQTRLADTDSPVAAADVCFTANTGRGLFRHRLCVAGRDSRELADHLASWAADWSEVPSARVEGGETVNGCAPPAAPKIAFLFTGSEDAYAGMGRSLYTTQPTFRRVLEQCDRLLAERRGGPLVPAGVRADLFRGCVAGDAEDGDRGRLALFVVQHALAELWRSWGVAPHLVAGIGAGGTAAACAAGALSLGDALDLAAGREPAAGAYREPRIPLVMRAVDEDVGADLHERYGTEILVEIGPGISGRGRAPDRRPLRLPTLRPGGEWPGILMGLAHAYVRGAPVDWAGFDRDYSAMRRRVAVPTYPFQRERHWLADRVSTPAPGGARPLTAPVPAAARDLRREIESVSDGLPVLTGGVRALLAETLEYPGPIDPAADFTDLGMDSLMAAEFRERLQEALRVTVPRTFVSDHPNLDDLLTVLAEMLGSAMSSRTTPLHESTAP
ncbi:phosphopantetheine binding protein [Murinocardiopsis flavida]|uniref:Phosphopantetheine binding protein n=1 Tax=Murinocardiopsis flavida TaxID=645275 RepID=A0A2P8D550_9ACTN|nr:type I polyketide synthase [Murinocardiopsis flavida]PSK92341.1 phosphopantetheine binding protein [Murinocardiopsis flavida]